MRRKDVLNSPKLLELKQKRRRNVQNKILIFLFLFLVLMIGLAFISRIDKLNIKEIKISGNKIIDTELIHKVIEDNLNGHYLYFFPKSNFLLFPKSKIIKDLTEKYKRLKDILFNLENAQILAVSLGEREGKYIWCGENLNEETIKIEDNLCFFMDNSGYVFDTAPYFSGSVYFKFYGSLVDNNFSKESWNKLISFKEMLVNIKFKPVALYIKSDGDTEIYLANNVSLSQSPKIVFKSDFILDKTSQNLQAAISTDPLMSNLKNKPSSLLYIDLRFGNKVYYKFR